LHHKPQVCENVHKCSKGFLDYLYYGICHLYNLLITHSNIFTFFNMFHDSLNSSFLSSIFSLILCKFFPLYGTSSSHL
jgi:hypothetical protein